MNNTRIYLVTNCYGDPNKVYIGKEKQPCKKTRKYYHCKVFGQQIEFDYIDQINGWDKKNWEPLESYWIEQFKAWGFEVLNKNKGGSGPSFQTEEIKLKLRKPKPPIFSEKMKKPRTSDFKKGPEHKWYGKIRGPRSYEHNILLSKAHYKPILQYDLKGNFIKEWINVVSAINLMGGDIVACLKGRQKTSCGFIWKYKDNNNGKI